MKNNFVFNIILRLVLLLTLFAVDYFAQEEYQFLDLNYDEVLEKMGKAPNILEVTSGLTSMIYYIKEGENTNTTEYIIWPYVNVVKQIKVRYDKITTFKKHKANIKYFVKVLKKHGFELWKTADDPYSEIYRNGMAIALIRIIYSGGNHLNLEDFSLEVQYMSDLSYLENVN